MSAADETARLLHIEQADAGICDIWAFMAELKAYHPETSTSERLALWRKYAATDQVAATHDPYTGWPL